MHRSVQPAKGQVFLLARDVQEEGPSLTAHRKPDSDEPAPSFCMLVLFLLIETGLFSVSLTVLELTL